MHRPFSKLRNRILVLKPISEQRKSMKEVITEAEKHKGETWDCSICGQQVKAEKYPKHYFKCKMKLELGKRGYA